MDVEDQMYNGEAIRSELEREELGSFGFKLELKTDSSFTQGIKSFPSKFHKISYRFIYIKSI